MAMAVGAIDTPKFLFVAAAACGLLSVPQACAQDYPHKPIRFIVPQPPGGTSDILARVFTQKLAENLHQQVIIDNRAGASGRTRAVNRVPACGM